MTPSRAPAPKCQCNGGTSRKDARMHDDHLRHNLGERITVTASNGGRGCYFTSVMRAHTERPADRAQHE